MLSGYGRYGQLVKYADTAVMMANHLLITDTATMLKDRVKYSDTAYLVANRLKISDTLSMLSGYGRYGQLVKYDDVPGLSVNYANSAGSIPWGSVTGKPTFATVATTGSYGDLINKPTLSLITNDAGFITSSGRAYPRRSDGTNIDFIWSGQSGQPSWLYGSNDGVNNYVWNPSNFSVNYASSAGNSATTSQRTFSNVRTDGLNRGSYGSISISGNNNGWAGIDFADASTTLMVRASDGYSGMYRNNNTWLWSFDNNGALAAGSVPYSRLTGTPSLDFATHRGEGSSYVDYSRNVYNNGAYSGSGWVEPSDLGVRYAASAGSAGSATNATNATYGRYVYNNGAYSGSGWVEASDLGVRYSASAGSATSATNATYGRYVYNDGAYSGSGWVEASDLGVRYASSANVSNTLVNSATVTDLYNNGWFRSNGSTGWYNQTYGGGIYMADASYVRTYGSKHFYCDQNIYAGGDINAGGDIIGFTSTPSDARLKHNFRKITNPLEIIRKINGYRFEWNRDNKTDIGVKAQEVEKVLPELVKERALEFFGKKGKKYKVVDYQKMIPLLLEAIKILDDKVRILEEDKKAKGGVQ